MNAERFRWLGTKLRRLLRRRREEAALDAELQFHLDQLAAEYRAEGMSEAEAKRAARREFGAADLYREEIRDAWRPPELADLWRSLRLAAVSLARSPGFTLIAVVTLALGIGANTAMFSLINTILLEPLPYPDSGQLDRIVRVSAQNPAGGIAPADYFDLLHEAGGIYPEIAAFAFGDASLSEPGQPPEYEMAARVTANFFSTFGIQPGLGRGFQPDELVPGNNEVLVISRRCWLSRFGGARDVLGRVVRVDGVPHRIVGVMPESFNDWRDLGWVDLFRPLAFSEAEAADRSSPPLRLVGRRARTRSPAEAAAFIENFGRRLAADFPAIHAATTWRAVPLPETVMSSESRAILAMLVGLSGFVLLIACSNLANFLLARTMARAREFAVRGALGASRLQLLRPLVVESLVLALAGGICAVFVAFWFSDWMSVRSTNSDNGERLHFALNWMVFSWAFLASLVTAVAFGLAPALFALRLDLNHTLKSGGLGSVGGRGHQRLRHALIVGQFALAMVLLAGAALFLRGLDELNNHRFGWETDRLVTGTILLPAANYPGPDPITAFHRRTLERLGAMPGVESASLSYFLPFSRTTVPRKYLVEGRPPPAPGREPVALVNGVSPGYFATVGTSVIAGRPFNEQDTLGSPRVFIINQGMARGLFGDENPLGRRLVQAGGDAGASGEIVGVVGDVRSVFPDPNPVTFQLYQPMAQEPRLRGEIAVRTSGVAPAALVDSVRTVMTALDPDLPVRNLKTANARIAQANYQFGVLRDVLSSFAVLGLGLASMGIYGVIARLMAQRTGEFGIRLALGAQVRDIVGIVLASGVKLALVGATLGLLGAYGVSRILASAFPNLRLESVATLAGAVAVLIGVALLACYLPARTASRISPMAALRAD